MSISTEEIAGLVVKLREKYSEYYAINPKWFDPQPFEERLLMAQKNRMNMEGFILAEIANFEKTRERFDKKKKERPFSEKIDRIIEENLARIRKYPRIEFHQMAGLEITYFYGAVSDFALNYFPVLWILNLEDIHKRSLMVYEQALEIIASPRGTKPSRRIEDHILLLSRKGVTELEIERDNNNYLKDSALLLHEIIDFTDSLLESRRDDWASPLSFSRLYIEESRKKKIVDNFSGVTGYGALVIMKDCAQGIIDDFRLRAFRR